MLATNFWAFHMFQTVMHDSFGEGEFENVSKLPLWQVGAAGALAAIPVAFLAGPAEQVKIRLQIGASSTTLQAMRSIWREGGVRGIFRGSVMTIARDGPSGFAYFSLYEGIKRWAGHADSAIKNAAAIVMAGG